MIWAWPPAHLTLTVDDSFIPLFIVASLSTVGVAARYRALPGGKSGAVAPPPLPSLLLQLSRCCADRSVVARAHPGDCTDWRLGLRNRGSVLPAHVLSARGTRRLPEPLLPPRAGTVEPLSRQPRSRLDRSAGSTPRDAGHCRARSRRLAGPPLRVRPVHSGPRARHFVHTDVLGSGAKRRQSVAGGVPRGF